jgi:hypothetical protein
MKRIHGWVLGAAVALGGSASAAEVDNRVARQQDRIGQGIQSGSLNPNEAVHLEGREARVQNEIQRDRAANGGHLTPQEREHINRQQNRISHDIYRKKHNAR